LIQLPQ
jgi:hypothetical protein